MKGLKILKINPISDNITAPVFRMIHKELEIRMFDRKIVMNDVLLQELAKVIGTTEKSIHTIIMQLACRSKCIEILRDDFFSKYTSKPGTKEYGYEVNLNKNYGISLEEYNNLYSKQDGKCAICKRTEEESGFKFHVDHCHETGKVRGLLCNGCNIGVGHFSEDVKRLKSAIEYIENSL